MAALPWATAWVTGASSGIGFEVGRQLAAAGVDVAVSARSVDRLADLAATDPHITAWPVDVTDETKVRETVVAIDSAAPIDLAVLNAGAWTLGAFAALDTAAIRKGVEVNIMGVVHCLAAVLPGMLDRGRGHIAIVASVAGYRGLPNAGAYGPTKAALINLAETLRCELAPRGVTVSVVNPGFVDTPLTRDNPFPMPQLISAEDAAGRIIAGLARGGFELLFPHPFGMVMKTLRLMPYRAYFGLIRRFVMRR